MQQVLHFLEAAVHLFPMQQGYGQGLSGTHLVPMIMEVAASAVSPIDVHSSFRAFRILMLLSGNHEAKRVSSRFLCCLRCNAIEVWFLRRSGCRCWSANDSIILRSISLIFCDDYANSTIVCRGCTLTATRSHSLHSISVLRWNYLNIHMAVAAAAGTNGTQL